MHTTEGVLLIINIICFSLILLRYKQTGKRYVLCVLLFGVALAISLSGMSTALTTDERHYMYFFINMEEMINRPQMIKEYISSQFFIATLVQAIEQAVGELDYATGVILCKGIHWEWCLSFIFLIVFQCEGYLLDKGSVDRKNYSQRSIIIMVLLMLFLLCPVNSLLMKVVNYDGFATYLIVLGCILMMRFWANGKNIYGYMACVVGMLAGVEKISSIPWMWLLIVLFGIRVGKQKEPFQKNIVKAMIHLCCCLLMLLLLILIMGIYIKYVLARGQSGYSINFEWCLRVFAFLPIRIWTSMSTAKAAVFMVVATILFVFTWRMFENKIQRIISMHTIVFKRALVLLMVCVFLLGLFGVYSVPQYRTNWNILEESDYANVVSQGKNYGYSYLTSSPLNYYFRETAFTYGVLLNAIPTGLLVIFGIYCLKLWKYSDVTMRELLLGIALLFPAMVTSAMITGTGHEQLSRYYAIPILLGGMCVTLSILEDENFVWKNIYRKIGVVICCIMTIFEVILYHPNISCFTPLWNVMSFNADKRFKVGERYVGDALGWGEELGIACEYISDNCTENTIVYTDTWSDYWVYSDSLNIISMKATDIDQIDFLFDDSTFYIFTKEGMRSERIPEFINVVEPEYWIKYKEETSAWVYRGNQIEQYARTKGKQPLDYIR